jgi:REP element-mobilizing transposase RayT
MDYIATGSGDGLRRQGVMETRKDNRLEFYDYSQNGAYFITICTKDKRKIFWEKNRNDKLGTIEFVRDGVPDVPQTKLCENGISPIGFVRDGAPDVPQIQLSHYGKIVNNIINEINETYNHISIDKYVIMPNHIHMILNVLYDPKGTSRTPSRTNEIVPSVISYLKRRTNKECNMKLWHRSYYDHVIRNEQDYRRIWEYIDTNPTKWELDCYYTP